MFGDGPSPLGEVELSASWTAKTEREYITDLAVVALSPVEVDGGASQEFYRVTPI